MKNELENLEEKAREIRNEYMRKWLREYRKKHPDKVRQWNRNYWLNKARKEIEEKEKKA